MSDARDAWLATPLGGVFVRRLTVHPDERGSFSELWRAEWFSDLPATVKPMRQANVSHSAAGVLRGLHLHGRQTDYWVIAGGRAFVALLDIRPVIAGSGAPHVHTLDAEEGTAVLIPEGVAHAFYAYEPLTLVYMVTNEYDGSDELAIAWDDPGAAVPWPDVTPLISDRDREAGTLADAVARIRAGERRGHG